MDAGIGIEHAHGIVAADNDGFRARPIDGYILADGQSAVQGDCPLQARCEGNFFLQEKSGGNIPSKDRSCAGFLSQYPFIETIDKEVSPDFATGGKTSARSSRLAAQKK